VKEHDWITNEGCEPMPEYIDVDALHSDDNDDDDDDDDDNDDDDDDDVHAMGDQEMDSLGIDTMLSGSEYSSSSSEEEDDDDDDDGIGAFVLFCFLCCFALFIDLVTDQVQPLSRRRQDRCVNDKTIRVHHFPRQTKKHLFRPPHRSFTHH